MLCNILLLCWSPQASWDYLIHNVDCSSQKLGYLGLRCPFVSPSVRECIIVHDSSGIKHADVVCQDLVRVILHLLFILLFIIYDVTCLYEFFCVTSLHHAVEHIIFWDLQYPTLYELRFLISMMTYYNPGIMASDCWWLLLDFLLICRHTEFDCAFS